MCLGHPCPEKPGSAGNICLDNLFMPLSNWRRIGADLLFSAATLLAASAWPAEPQQVGGHVPAVVARGLARRPAPRLAAVASGHRPAPAQPPSLDQLPPATLRSGQPPLSSIPSTRAFSTASFGPQEKDYQALRQFAQSHGLTVTGTHPNRMVLDAVGGGDRRSFHVKLGVYPTPPSQGRFMRRMWQPTPDSWRSQC